MKVVKPARISRRKLRAARFDLEEAWRSEGFKGVPELRCKRCSRPAYISRPARSIRDGLRGRRRSAKCAACAPRDCAITWESMFARRTEWNLSANRYSLAVEAARRGGRPLLELTASNPTTVGLHYERERILRALQHPRALEYEPACKGILPAREAVAAYYAERGVALSPERIILTVSTSEAYSYCFRLLCDPGDEVLVPSPSYPLFEFLADIQDVKLVPYELVYDHGWQIEFESLRRAITPRSRAIMVVHPNNPTGHFTRALGVGAAEHACREHELALVADEVFLDYGLMAGGSTAARAERSAAELCGQRWRADVHPERALENLRAAADQSGVDCRQRPGGAGANRARPSGRHRRHVSFAERAGAVGGSRTARQRARGFSGSCASARGAICANSTRNLQRRR